MFSSSTDAKGNQMTNTTVLPRCTTTALLVAGIVGGIQVAIVSLTLASVREGFDVRRHANSQLVLGDWGWVQTVNFFVFGLLLIAGGTGVVRATGPRISGIVAGVGMSVYGLGSGVIVAFNPPSPFFGFPPGATQGYPGFDEIDLAAKIHGIAGMIGFLAMTIACFAFARYFAGNRDRLWTVASAVVGLSVVAVCVYLAGYAGDQVTSFNYVPTWVVGTVLWLFVSAVSWKILTTARAGAHR